MKDGGFTLVEIVVSLAIIGITLVLLLSVFNKTIVTAAENGGITDAVMLGSEKMASIDFGGFPEKGDDGTWRTDQRYPRFDYRSTITQTPFPDVRAIRIRVRHDGKEAFSIDRYVVKR
ncbi:MAG: prepilin-type N-terminal cleavage/methylation domain-containing protein [Nitrospinae bacterium]|nr:prepilin-type N-terminal cleavage/methylation domain-containing protein [Nitrospinota bacterium]